MTLNHLNRRLSSAGFVALLLAALASCEDDPTPPEDPKLTGEWTGTVTLPQNLTAAITLGLSEDDSGNVTGTMTYTVLGQTGSGPVTGTHNYPNVVLSLKLEIAGTELTGKYEAKLTTKDRMDGTFRTDDGVISGALVMDRKTT